MTVLVLYASIEGQTRKIAEHVARALELSGQQVVLGDVRDPGFAVPARFEGAVLCAPIHMGRYPEPFAQFMVDWKDALQSIPCAFVSVSLAIRSENEDEREEARNYPKRLMRKTGWLPADIHHAAGALKYLEYDFFKRWIMRRIAKAEGGPVDTSHDYELTDWKALDAFLEGFVKKLG